MASAEKSWWRRKRRGAGQPVEGMGSTGEPPAPGPCWVGAECRGEGWDRGRLSARLCVRPSLVWFAVLSTNTSLRAQKTCGAFKKKREKNPPLYKV